MQLPYLNCYRFYTRLREAVSTVAVCDRDIGTRLREVNIVLIDNRCIGDIECLITVHRYCMSFIINGESFSVRSSPLRSLFPAGTTRLADPDELVVSVPSNAFDVTVGV